MRREEEMSKLVCVECNRELRPEQNGIYLVELFADDKKVYKIWTADLWKCPDCGKEIVSGFADNPLFEHYQGDGEANVGKIRKSGGKIIFCKEHLYTELPRM